jgi:hypothetical protein
MLLPLFAACHYAGQLGKLRAGCLTGATGALGTGQGR